MLLQHVCASQGGVLRGATLVTMALERSSVQTAGKSPEILSIH